MGAERQISLFRRQVSKITINFLKDPKDIKYSGFLNLFTQTLHWAAIVLHHNIQDLPEEHNSQGLPSEKGAFIR